MQEFKWIPADKPPKEWSVVLCAAYDKDREENSKQQGYIIAEFHDGEFYIEQFRRYNDGTAELSEGYPASKSNIKIVAWSYIPTYVGV